MGDGIPVLEDELEAGFRAVLENPSTETMRRFAARLLGGTNARELVKEFPPRATRALTVEEAKALKRALEGGGDGS